MSASVQEGAATRLAVASRATGRCPHTGPQNRPNLSGMPRSCSPRSQQAEVVNQGGRQSCRLQRRPGTAETLTPGLDRAFVVKTPGSELPVSWTAAKAATKAFGPWRTDRTRSRKDGGCFKHTRSGARERQQQRATDDARVQLTDLSPRPTPPDACATGNPPQSDTTGRARSPERARV